MTVTALTPATSTETGYRTHQRQDPMAKVATALGLSSSDLRTQLKSGKSLEDIATAQGVSHDDLITAIKAGMPADKSSAVNSTEIAEKIAGTKGLPKPPEGGHHSHGPHGVNGERPMNVNVATDGGVDITV